MNFQTKQHNTRNAFKATLSEPTGNPVDLTGASVKMVMKSKTGKTVINRSMQVAESGQVLLVFESDEVKNAGSFDAELIVTYADERKEIYPNSGYIKIDIQASLGGA